MLFLLAKSPPIHSRVVCDVVVEMVLDFTPLHLWKFMVRRRKRKEKIDCLKF